MPNGTSTGTRKGGILTVVVLLAVIGGFTYCQNNSEEQPWQQIASPTASTTTQDGQRAIYVEVKTNYGGQFVASDTRRIKLSITATGTAFPGPPRFSTEAPFPQPIFGRTFDPKGQGQLKVEASILEDSSAPTQLTCLVHLDTPKGPIVASDARSEPLKLDQAHIPVTCPWKYPTG